MRKILFGFLVIVVTSSISAQLNTNRPILIEKNIFPKDSLFICYISYRIPYKNLVFTKDGNVYAGGLNLDVEFTKKNKIYKRTASKREIALSDYKKTSSEDIYLQGVLETVIEPGRYVVNPYLSIHNTNKTIALEPINVITGKATDDFVLRPLVVQNNIQQCDKENLFRLVNYNNVIPYSPQDYQLVIPSVDDSINRLNIEILQNNQVVFRDNIGESLTRNIKIDECRNQIFLQSNIDSNYTNYFILKSFSQYLSEENAIIRIRHESMPIRTFSFRVFWIDKPRTLNNVEFAVKLLRVILSEKEYNDLLKKYDDDYSKILINFWKERDPVKDTKFNELENEFYSRADYAIINFSTIDKNNGAYSDRGKIYIKYGKPDEKNRVYSNNNEVLEIWKYDKLDKEFVFSDITGLGNYKLKN